MFRRIAFGLLLSLLTSPALAGVCLFEGFSELPPLSPGCPQRQPDQTDARLPGGIKCPGSAKAERMIDGTPECRRFYGGGQQILLALDQKCPAGTQRVGLDGAFIVCNLIDAPKRAAVFPICPKGFVPIIEYNGDPSCRRDSRIAMTRYFATEDECPVGTRHGTFPSGAIGCAKR